MKIYYLYLVSDFCTLVEFLTLIIYCTCNICIRKKRGNFNLEGEKGEFECIYKPTYVVINIRGFSFLGLFFIQQYNTYSYLHCCIISNSIFSSSPTPRGSLLSLGQKLLYFDFIIYNMLRLFSLLSNPHEPSFFFLECQAYPNILLDEI